MAKRTISTCPLLEPFERPSAAALACLSVFSSAVRLGFGSIAETKGKGAATCHLPWRQAAREKRPVLISYLSNKKLLHCEFDCTFLISFQSSPLVVPCLSCLLFCFKTGTNQKGNSAVLSPLRTGIVCKAGYIFSFLLSIFRREWFWSTKSFCDSVPFFWSVVFFSFRGKLIKVSKAVLASIVSESGPPKNLGVLEAGCSWKIFFLYKTFQNCHQMTSSELKPSVEADQKFFPHCFHPLEHIEGQNQITWERKHFLSSVLFLLNQWSEFWWSL